MEMKELVIKPRGTVRLVQWDGKDADTQEEAIARGVVKMDRTIPNLILTDGVEIFADCLRANDAAQDYLKVIAVGTSSQAPVIADVDLIGSELGRGVTTNSHPTPGKARFVFTFGAGVATGTWEEAVLADTDAASGGRKCATRTLTGTVVKAAGDILTVTWDIEFPTS